MGKVLAEAKGMREESDYKDFVSYYNGGVRGGETPSIEDRDFFKGGDVKGRRT